MRIDQLLLLMRTGSKGSYSFGLDKIKYRFLNSLLESRYLDNVALSAFK